MKKSKLVLLPLLALVGSNIASLPANAAGDLAKLREEVTNILDASCSRCHQVGKLSEKRKDPAHNFGNVLDLDVLIRDKKYISPGNPDNSKLWKTMMDGTMPYDVYNGDFEAHSPSKEDIEKVADWIRAEGEAGKELLASREFITEEEFLSAIADDLGKLPEHRVKATRYISLVNLYNGGASDEAMEVYRQGTVKLVNSLHYEPDPVMYEKLGPKDTILRINLDDMGWDTDRWDKLQANNPVVVKYDNSLARFIETQTDSAAPILRADAFAFVATRPPLYNNLLDLPEDFAKLQEKLGIDINKSIEKNRVARAGFQESGVSQNNRLIERIPFKNGAFWNSYDFAGNKDNQSLFLHPLGPEGEKAFHHDGGEMIFNLPNGFQAYYLSTAKGKMLISGPTEIVRDPRRRDLKVTNGVSCMSCHVHGIREDHSDEIRDYVLASASFDKETRKKVEAIYPTKEDMAKLMKKDKERFMSANRAAGIDPTLLLDGQYEMTSALSDQFERNLTLEMAAAEFNMTVEQFEQAIPRGGKEGFDLLRRLKQDQVPRDQFMGLFATLVNDITDNESLAQEDSKDASKKIKKERNEAHQDFDLALFADKDEYKVDEKAVFSIKSEKACSLTLINVDGNGTSTVLLPNKFRKDPVKLKPGKKLSFPSKADGFQFRLADKGEEKVIAICSTSHDYIPGVKYDFKTTFAKQGKEKKLNRSLSDAARYETTRAIKVEKSGKKTSKKIKVAKNDKNTKVKKKPVSQARKAITITVH